MFSTKMNAADKTIDETTTNTEEMKKRFYEKLTDSVNKKKDNHFYYPKERYTSILREVKEAKALKDKNSVHYRRLQRYEIYNIGGEEKLISRKSAKENKIHYFVCFEDLFHVIHEAHLAIGHGGRNRMQKELARDYKNVTIEAINTYLHLCKACLVNVKLGKKGIVVKPILHKEMNSRCQIDLIDMGSLPDREMKFIMVYQDHLTKFVLLRPQRDKSAEEVAKHLIEIFAIFGAPNILHSDNGKEFCNKIITAVCEMWIDVKVVHGKARHSQSQGSVERANQDVEKMLSKWMETNNTTHWVDGLRFVQVSKNRAYHEGIRCSPYQAMFGEEMKLGIRSLVGLRTVLNNIQSEDDLKNALNAGEEDKSADEDDVLEYDGNDDRRTKRTFDDMSSEDDGAVDDVTPRSNNLAIGGETSCNKDNVLRVFKISTFRRIAKEGLEKQAKKMLKTSSGKLANPSVGQCVIVKIPDVDRGRMDPKSVMTVVTAIKGERLYELGTQYGKLNSLYTNNQFTLCEEKFLKVGDVPEKYLSLRSTVKKLSLFGGQGVKKCSCKQGCNNKKCSCASNNRACSRKCHVGKSCNNVM